MEIGETRSDKPYACLGGCGTMLTNHTFAGQFETPGDEADVKYISICVNCGHIAMMEWGSGPRPLTDQEMYDVAGEPMIVEAQRARARYVAEREFFEQFKSEEEP